MSGSAPTQPDDEAAAAWHRHYAAAAERRREAARHRGPHRPYLRYAQREARWLLAFALVAAALLIAGASLFR